MRNLAWSLFFGSSAVVSGINADHAGSFWPNGVASVYLLFCTILFAYGEGRDDRG